MRKGWIGKNIIFFYKFAILVLFVGLMFSKYLVGLSQFLILGLWIVEGKWKLKYDRLKQDIPALIFLSIFGIFVISLLWTKNFDDAFFDLQIKLPLLAIPLVFATTQRFSDKDILDILKLFVVVVFAKTMQSFIFIVIERFSPNLSKISINLSHIRYALMIDTAIFSLLEIFRQQKDLKISYKILLFFLIFWFLAFLIFVKSLTGIIIFLIVLIYIALRLIFKSRILWFKITAFFIVLMMIGGVYFYLHKQVVDFYTFKDPPYNELPKFTEAGNKYKHDSTNIYRENGYRVGYYLCVKEMKSEWNKISDIQYDSIINGYPLRATLIRYLTSKGLPKDSVGVSKLTKRDIENINKGITNYKFANTLKLSNRIYKVIWQIYVYSKAKNANNQSVTQRYEFYKTAMHIIYNNVWLGVGVGDVKDAYERQYVIDKTNLLPKNRLRAHNQFVTQILTLGIFLGMWTIIALFLPFFMNKKNKNFISTAFFILAILSMFTDDVFETSVSVGFFIIFYTILILIKTQKNDNKSTN